MSLNMFSRHVILYTSRCSLILNDSGQRAKFGDVLLPPMVIHVGDLPVLIEDQPESAIIDQARRQLAPAQRIKQPVLDAEIRLLQAHVDYPLRSL